MFSAVTALLPPLARALSGVRDLIEMVFVPAPPNIAWAALLVIFGSALGKRKRSAWWFLVVILALGMLESVTLLPESRILARRRSSPSAPPGVLRDPAAGPQGVLRDRPARANVGDRAGDPVVGIRIAIPIGWALVEALPGSVPRSDALAYAVNQVLGGLGDAGTRPGSRGGPPGRCPSCSVRSGTVVYVAFGLALFRTRGNERRISGQDEVDLRVLLHDHGDRDSLGYFATRRDKSVMWSPSHKAAVTYRVVNGVSLASRRTRSATRSPGRRPSRRGWRRRVTTDGRRRSWVPPKPVPRPTCAPGWRRCLSGTRRSSSSRSTPSTAVTCGRCGRRCTASSGTVTPPGCAGTATSRPISMAEVIVDADRWRDTDNERGFSMALGRLGDPLDGECVLTEIFDAGGCPARAAVASRRGVTAGISLDLMRRDPDAENGVMEMMVTATVNAGPLIGVDRLSLNFAVMRAIFEEGAKIGAGPVMRATRGRS